MKMGRIVAISGSPHPFFERVFEKAGHLTFLAIRNLSQTPNHQVYHRQIYHCFAGVCQVFVVLAQPAITPQPRKCSFYNPQPWSHHKTSLAAFGSSLNLEIPTTMLHNPVNQLSGISSIRPDFAQATHAIFDAIEYQLGPVSVLHVGAGDHHANN